MPRGKLQTPLTHLDARARPTMVDIGAKAVTHRVAVAQAQGPVTTPEIDPTSSLGALVLLSGALLVLRARRKN